MLRKTLSLKTKQVAGGKELKTCRETFFAKLFGSDSATEEDASTEPSSSPERIVQVLAERALALVRSLLFPKKAQVALHKLAHGKDGESLTAVVVNDVAVAVMDARLARDGPAQGAAWFPTVFCLVLLNALVEYVVAHAEEEDAPGAATTWADVLAAHGTVDDAVSVALMCRVMQALLLNPLPAAGEPRSMVWTNSATSSFVLRGAHLMKAGVLGSHCGTGDDQHGALSLSYIATRWCPVPYAVGVLQPWQPDDDKGVAVTVLHTLHDALWQHFAPSFSKAIKTMCPNTTHVTAFPPWFPTAATDGRGVAVVLHGPRPMVPNCSRDSLISEVWGCTSTGYSTRSNHPSSSAELYDAEQQLYDEGEESATTTASSEPQQSSTSSTSTSCEEGRAAEQEVSITDLDQLTSLLYDATEQGELDDELESGDHEYFRDLFPSVDEILTFALCEACRKMTPIISARTPMPYHTFVAFLGKQYPRVPVTSAAYGMLRSIMTPQETGFDFKKTTYKRAREFLDAHVPFLLVTMSCGASLPHHSVSPGGVIGTKHISNHLGTGHHNNEEVCIVQIVKRSEYMMRHIERYHEFIRTIHQPLMDCEELQRQFGDGGCGGDGGGSGTNSSAPMRGGCGTASIPKLKSVATRYMPKPTLHVALRQVLCGFQENDPDADDGSSAERDDILSGLYDPIVLTANLFAYAAMAKLTREQLSTEERRVVPKGHEAVGPWAAVNRILSHHWPRKVGSPRQGKSSSCTTSSGDPLVAGGQASFVSLERFAHDLIVAHFQPMHVATFFNDDRREDEEGDPHRTLHRVLPGNPKPIVITAARQQPQKPQQVAVAPFSSVRQGTSPLSNSHSSGRRRLQTTVEHLEPLRQYMDKIAGEWRRLLSVSVTVVTAAGGLSVKAVLQGNQVHEVAEWLRTEMDWPAELIVEKFHGIVPTKKFPTKRSM